ncbi:WD repeat-containing protein 26 homolog [Rhagoletis pomonella]|uniref:WD repeat-containing protein 26 homolog n=1 Tax=Rhagoletis pomonella TaxID=28610 RepID=UPI0017852764|nr:WD repeat-containing protein 26 homolog [Rhagoletis pomonella]XP_036326210.1 WD repeat-containing protein 26 homolog [Rhagoletis pomonella]XP_036326211.1 WD repeat-containing protein 26 homolog [Rhagoletis pomonella]
MQNSALNPSSSSASSSGSGTGTGTGSASVSASGAAPVGNSSSANSAADGGGGGGSSTLGPAGGDSLANVSNSANSSTSTSNGHDTKHNGFSDNNESGTLDAQNNHDQSIVAVANHNFHLDKTNQEIIRLIGQYLQDIGLDKSVKTLMTESGCYLEHPAASKFREHVLSGEWGKADADLKELEPLIDNGKPSTIIEMKFLLLEQKYLEFLDDGCPLDALHVLRNELTPLQHNTSRVHQLSSYMMCSNNHDLYQRAKWEGKGILSRAVVMDRLQAFLPPSVMMPPRRLRHLLQQAVELQSKHCDFHDMAFKTNLQSVSLLSDHTCDTDGFPMQTIQVLTDHCDEVWYCKFSPDGLKLATGSKDSTVIIWGVDPYKLTLKHRRILEGQSNISVAFVSWSPDSKLLLVGGPDDTPEICIWNVEDGKLVLKMSQSVDDSLSCGAFNRDGTRFVCGGQKGQFYLCDLSGTILNTWEGVRINSVAYRADNKTIIASDSHYRIRGYNFEDPGTDFDILKEPHPIMTFTVNSADRLALLNISSQGLHLWDLEDKCLVRRFQGIRQSKFAIHSCFGGVNESFVASGSEDKLVCIWHIRREEPLGKLAGHTKTVNCVSWNPVYPSLLASASDDATVRIWGPKSHSANATPESDDCSSCSSSSSWNMTS